MSFSFEAQYAAMRERQALERQTGQPVGLCAVCNEYRVVSALRQFRLSEPWVRWCDRHQPDELPAWAIAAQPILPALPA